MLASIITLLALVTTAISILLEARQGTALDLSEVYMRNITYGGSGCPQGSVGQFLSDDRDTFTLIFDSFQAQTGPGTTPDESRRYCQINLDLNYPQGFQYSVFQTTFRGYTYLDPAVTARESALYYFSGPNQQQVTTSTTFHGPVNENYVINSAVAFTSLVWSPCGAHWPLNLGTQVTLTSTNSSQSGLMTDDTIDGSIKYITGIQWQRC
ncbi:uncharacterized protein PAC_17909 [Phialocephala subalpina]|uniref:Secreted protein n=1 Tax=Phialocephala subalpina TaxID=576137 RepID=A0A1L7XSJ2_9HELO|nr:uncharacterized protein PAC_17909 [Phialocephala subalpina]